MNIHAQVVDIHFIERYPAVILHIDMTKSELEEFGGFDGPPFPARLLSWTDPNDIISDGLSLDENVVIKPAI